MTLGEVIAWLEQCDAAQRVPVGFAHPHSYRGDYYDLAFEVEPHTAIAALLTSARSALGQTYQGWKGGDYTMNEHTDCWLVAAEGDTGESIGPVLLAYMTGRFDLLEQHLLSSVRYRSRGDDNDNDHVGADG